MMRKILVDSTKNNIINTSILLVLSLTLIHCSSTKEATSENYIGLDSTLTKKEAVDELMALMKMKQQVNKNMEVTADMLAKSNPMLATYKDELEKFYKKYLSWEKIGDDIKKVYSDNYTQKELNMLVGFYRTDSGQNIAKKMPEIFRQSAEIGRKIAMKHRNELQQMIMKKAQSQ